MAKLSAHGRTEVLRLEKKQPHSDPLTGQPYPFPEYWKKQSYVFMSDRTLLSKTSWKGPHDYRPYDGGWKIVCRLKEDVFANLLQSKSVQGLLMNGYQIV